MVSNPQNLKELVDIAVLAAKEAANYIRNYKKENLEILHKPEYSNKNQPSAGTSLASQVVTDVDIECEKIILDILAPTFEKYQLGLLSEEKEDYKDRLTKDFFWCIDPLDGTLPFSQGFDGYSVSIALVAKDATPLIGVICNPVTGDIYSAAQGLGVLKNNEKFDNSNSDQSDVFTLIVDRSFSRHEKYKDIINSINKRVIEEGYSALKMIKQGGAVMNAIWVLENQPACYFKLPKKEIGGGSIWDFAATACIFREYGASATNFCGLGLDLNRKDSTFMNHEGVIYASQKKITTFFQNLKLD